MIDKGKLINSVKLLERKIFIIRIKKIEKLLDQKEPSHTQINKEIAEIMRAYYKNRATIQTIKNFGKKTAGGVEVTMPENN